MRYILAVLLLLTITSCYNDYFSFSVTYQASAKSSTIKIPIKKIYHEQRIEIIANTIDDTCMIGIIKIPPGKTGKLYKTDFFSAQDTFAYTCTAYKATKGLLKYNHIFSSY